MSTQEPAPDDTNPFAAADDAVRDAAEAFDASNRGPYDAYRDARENLNSAIERRNELKRGRR